MENITKKLTLQDLQIGMHIKVEQLSNLFGVWVYLNPSTVNKDTGDVDILYFCTAETKDDDKIQAIFDKYGKATTFYQPSYYADENIDIYDD